MAAREPSARGARLMAGARDALPLRVAVLGGGEIGAGWAALFASHGVPVCIADPDAAALERARAALRIARELGVGNAGTAVGELTRVSESARAVRDVEWVVESLPERLETKRAVLASLAGSLPPRAVVASSSSSITARELAWGRPFGARLVLAHPLQPVYAVPVVELGGWAESAPWVLERAAAVLRALGREPVVVRGEVPGLVANRLTAALLREAVDLIARGAISAGELDVLVARGLAPGWSVAGALGVEAIGAGSEGLAGLVERMAEPLATLWRSLASWHALDDVHRAALVEAARAIPAAPLGAPADAKAWAESLARVERVGRGKASHVGPLRIPDAAIE